MQLHEDVIITVDEHHRIRVWATKGHQQLLAQFKHKSFHLGCSTWGLPTSLAIDNSGNNQNTLPILIGFNDGGFGVYAFKKKEKAIQFQYRHAASTSGIISAISYASSYLVTMTESQLLSIYRFPLASVGDRIDPILDPPRLLTSLRSHTAWPPLTLSTRVSPKYIVVSIAYALPTCLSGWSIGLQELRLTPQGNIDQSRLASSTDQGFSPLKMAASRLSSTTSGLDTSLRKPYFNAQSTISKPTSLSYSHPYLLASHPDNTLTLYLVSSSEERLVIGPGSRLWGHTSAVSKVHVDDRGKAVSVSLKGGEIRVWELEGGISSKSKRNMISGEVSVQVRPEPNYESKLGANAKVSVCHGDLAVNKGWVGFDEGKVVVLHEKSERSQALTIYDFS